MKTALITGAYRGLGYEVARELAGRGWKVIVSARRRNEGSAAAAKLTNASFQEMDITDDASVLRAAAEAPALDVLINNAAVISEGDQDILSLKPELIARTIATNALGALRVSPKRKLRFNGVRMRQIIRQATVGNPGVTF